MRSVHPSTPAFQPGRHLEVLDEPVHDAQRDAEKLPEAAVCTDCGAVYQAGQWQWTSASAHALQIRCPACRRIADGRPAGSLKIEGQYAQAHRDEIEQLVRAVEQREKTAHPLQRVMAVDDVNDAIEVSTTGIPLARAIGEALLEAHEGKLLVDYDEDEGVVRARWVR